MFINKMQTKVITSERIKNYLYSLGFDYKTKPDLKNSTKNIWIFDVNENYLEAMYFYDSFREKMGFR